MLEISSGFLTYLERASSGDRVIWVPGMNILTCYSQRFSGDHNQLIFGHYIGQMFELAYEFDSHGHWDIRNPVGIAFWCADFQLVNHRQLLESVSTDGSLPAIEVLKDAIRYLKETKSLQEGERTHVASSYWFLRQEKIVIPKSELEAILRDVPRH